MSGTVSVFVASPDTRSERRFDLHLTVKQLKKKLEPVTGIAIDSQLIRLYNSEEDFNSNGNAVASLDRDDRPLGFYGLRDWQVISVTDTNPSGASLTGQFTDVSQVEKFELTDTEYAQRQDTVLAYKQRNKMGRFAEKEQEGITQSSNQDAAGIAVGARCEVEATETELKKRGTVRYVGPTKFGKGGGAWVGVEYDEPLGKNDGSVQGERYFTCRNMYGAFVRPDKVRVGDFPPEELSLDDEEM